MALVAEYLMKKYSDTSTRYLVPGTRYYQQVLFLCTALTLNSDEQRFFNKSLLEVVLFLSVRELIGKYGLRYIPGTRYLVW